MNKKLPEKKNWPHGRGKYRCRRCGTSRGTIRRAGLMICRRCIREIAPVLGFRKTGSRNG